MAGFAHVSLRSRHRMFNRASRRRMFSLRSRGRILNPQSRRRMFSLRSRRQRKAWGVSPRVKSMTAFKPANAGDRTAAAHFMGWFSKFFVVPGAYAPSMKRSPLSRDFLGTL